MPKQSFIRLVKEKDILHIVAQHEKATLCGINERDCCESTVNDIKRLKICGRCLMIDYLEDVDN